MTEEEKKAKLEEAREKLKAKKAAKAVEDKEEQRKNEVRLPPRLFFGRQEVGFHMI